MNLPTRQECFKLLEEYRVPRHVISHCLVVNKISIYLAKKLLEKGEKINVELVDTASLLHDFLRVCDFKNFDPEFFDQEITEEDRKKWDGLREKYKGYDHEIAAFDFFKDKYPELAQTIKMHKYRAIKDIGFENWEEKIVHYADKRVMHDKIVSLAERFEDGHIRNAAKDNSCNDVDDIDNMIYDLEKEIFSKLDITSDDILVLQPLDTKLVIFDYDGVIMNTFGITCKVYEKLAEENNVEFANNPEFFRDLLEVDWNISLDKLGIMDKEKRKRAETIFFDFMTLYKDDIKIYPGIKDVLEKLQGKVKLVIASNNSFPEIKSKLEREGLLKYFDYIFDIQHGRKPETGQLLSAMKKFDVKPGETVLVGDMDGDVLVGRRAGLKNVIAVTYGYHPKKKLEKADFIVDKPEHLLDVIVVE